jgi:hypothetical protein
VDTLVFFFDRTFGTRLPKVLASLDTPFTVKWHQAEGFAGNAPDDEWLNVIGPRKWICLSQDRQWHLRESELLAVKQHSIKCFYLANVHRWTTMCQITSRHEKIMQLSRARSGPFVYELKKNRQFYPVKLP